MGMDHVHNKRAGANTPIDFSLKMSGPFGPTRLTMKIASDIVPATMAPRRNGNARTPITGPSRRIPS